MASLAVLNDQDYLRLLEETEEEEELQEAEEELQEAEEEDLEELQGQQEHDGGAHIQFDAMDFATALGHELRRYPSLLELHQFLDPNPAVAGDGDDEDDDLASAQLKETASDGSACPICLLDDDDDDEDTAMAEGEWKETSCGHRFHGPCIDKWLSDKGSCPLCRRQLLKTTTKPPATVAPEDLDLVWNDLLGLYGEELVAGLSFVEFLDQNLG